MKKLFKLLTSTSLMLTTTLITTSTIITTSDYQNAQNLNKVNNTLNAQETKKDKTPIDFYSKTPILTLKTGPIISYGDKISALDWYGSVLWSFDFQSPSNKQYYPNKNPNDHPNYVNRAFINWALDSKRNRLWLLTNSLNSKSNNIPQNVVELDTDDGHVISCTPLTLKPSSMWDYFYQIQVLNNGNVQVYSQGNGNWGYNVLINGDNPKKQEFKNVYNIGWQNDIKSAYKANGITFNGELRMYYLIPISTGVNIAAFCDYNSMHTNGKGTGDLLLVLVDDQFQRIVVNKDSPWYNGILVKVNISDPTGQYTDNFSKTIYTTLDGRVYFTAWQQFFVFYPNFKEGYGIHYGVENFSADQRVLSYIMDVNENVFLKFWNDTKIYKLTISGDSSQTNFSLNSYYIIDNSKIDDVRKNATNFVLYNVTGYTGSIMMLSSRIINNGSDINNSTTDKNYQNYGIAVAITPNRQDDSSGDSPGLLNTEQSFTKSSDFTISQSVLDNKLPSEITKDDITLENNGFFTNNNQKDNNGTLKFPPFTVSKIDDEQGSFEVTVNLDQIPWFTTKLPDGSIPKTLTKDFKTTKKINEKISWKGNDSLSYDFKNTLPDKVTVDDLNNFDPFQVSFNSKVILNADGTQDYPKKIYSINSKNNDQGTITVGVKYEYVPLSGDGKTVLTYSASHQYNIFKSSTPKQFYFAGSQTEASSTDNSPIDIQNVPQLKSLSESNLLPSSFNANDKNAFLEFINTNKSQGYPISKMNFSVIPDDTSGTLKVTASVDKKYDDKESTFVQTFSGFNKKTNYSFSFKDNVTSIDNKAFSTMLASSVNEGDIVSSLITYTGFNSSDFQVQLYPDDKNGKLTVQINLDKSYVEALGNSNGFTNYKITHVFSGFMTNEEYNNQYNITFKQDNSQDLIELKKMTLSTIQDTFNKKESLNIGNKSYKSLNDLTERLFVDSLGTKVPTNWESEQYNGKITTQMTIDNQAGTMNLAVTIDKSLLNGYESNLAYVVSYSGFSKGNAVVTNDNLTFVSNDLLKTYVSEIKNMNASELKDWLTKDTSNINKLLFNVTGQYKDKISQKQFTLDIDTNDSYNTISIAIHFSGLTDSKSLTEYSIQYQL